MYATVNARSRAGREMMFWSYVNEYLITIGRGSTIVFIEDMNGRVGGEGE